MKLYKHQDKILKKNPKKHLLAWETGTGKTLGAILLAEKNTTHHVVLVICPKSIKDKWEEDVEPFKNHYRIMTKEQFKKGAYQLAAYDCVIVDEAHYFSGIKSQMSKVLITYLQKWKIEHVYLLTATPYLSTPWNLFTLARILGYRPNYGTWRKQYFFPMRIGRRLIYQVKANIEQDMAKIVNQIGMTVRMDEARDVPEQTFLTEYFDLTSAQRTAIKNITDLEPIVKWTKTHQICGGTLKSDGYTENQEFKSEKLQRVLDLANEHKKLIIVCRYNHEIKILSEKLKKHPNLVVITGATKDKHTLIKMADSSIQCVVLVNAACSEGYELPSFPIMVFYSYDFSLKNYVQMIGRILRINKLKKNVYISLVVKGTIDHDVYKSILKKKDFDIAIYNKLKE